MKRSAKKAVGGIKGGISEVKKRQSLFYDFDPNVVWAIKTCICHRGNGLCLVMFYNWENRICSVFDI